MILTSRCTNIHGEEAGACGSQHCTLGCQHVPHVQLKPPHTCPAWAHVSCMRCCPRAAAGDGTSESQPTTSIKRAMEGFGRQAVPGMHGRRPCDMGHRCKECIGVVESQDGARAPGGKSARQARVSMPAPRSTTCLGGSTTCRVVGSHGPLSYHAMSNDSACPSGNTRSGAGLNNLSP